MDIIITSIAIILIISLAGPLMPIEAYSQLPYSPNIQSSENRGNQNNKTNESSTSTKFVIINFDDGDINQYRYAKPILQGRL